MSALGQIRIGHKAPDFLCEAVISGVIEDVSLGTYIKPCKDSATPDLKAPWLIIMFIPAAFSFVCPTEVLAFQNCHDEFKDRNCNVVFVSVDTKHSLWHWQNVPRQYGGLGNIDIPLLSDANHRIATDYGVLIKEEGVSLRGMFIIDGQGVVQQVTLNNLTVGRSVLEALRLLEAFQAVAKHGVLCPIDWKPNNNAADTISTISNTLTESYEDRLANLQKEFGVQVTDLGAKHKSSSSKEDKSSPNIDKTTSDETTSFEGKAASIHSTQSQSSPIPPAVQDLPVEHSCPQTLSPDSSFRQDCLPRSLSSTNLIPPPHSSPATRSCSVPPTAHATPTPTPTSTNPPPRPGTARHSRGRSSSSHNFLAHRNMDLHYMSSLFSTQHNSSSSNIASPSIFQTLIRRISSPMATDSESGHSSTASISTPQQAKQAKSLPPHLVNKHTTYETRRGSHVTLEFADPTLSPSAGSPHSVPSTPLGLGPPPRSHSTGYQHSTTSRNSSPGLGNNTHHHHGGGPTSNGRGQSKSPDAILTPNGSAATSTRLQATFEAIKKMSAGLSSPRLDYSPRKTEVGKSGMTEDVRSPGILMLLLKGWRLE